MLQEPQHGVLIGVVFSGRSVAATCYAMRKPARKVPKEKPHRLPHDATNIYLFYNTILPLPLNHQRHLQAVVAYRGRGLCLPSLPSHLPLSCEDPRFLESSPLGLRPL